MPSIIKKAIKVGVTALLTKSTKSIAVNVTLVVLENVSKRTDNAVDDNVIQMMKYYLGEK